MRNNILKLCFMLVVFVYLGRPGQVWAADGGSGVGTGGNIAWECFTLAGGPAHDLFASGCDVWSPNSSKYFIEVRGALSSQYIVCGETLVRSGGGGDLGQLANPFTDEVAYIQWLHSRNANYLQVNLQVYNVIMDPPFVQIPNPVGPFTNSRNGCS